MSKLAIVFLARRLVCLCACMFVLRLASGFWKTRNSRTYRHTDLPTHKLVVRKNVRKQTRPHPRIKSSMQRMLACGERQCIQRRRSILSGNALLVIVMRLNACMTQCDS